MILNNWLEFLKKKYNISSEELKTYVLPKEGIAFDLNGMSYRVVHTRSNPYKFTAELTLLTKEDLKWTTRFQISLKILWKNFKKKLVKK